MTPALSPLFDDMTSNLALSNGRSGRLVQGLARGHVLQGAHRGPILSHSDPISAPRIWLWHVALGFHDAPAWGPPLSPTVAGNHSCRISISSSTSLRKVLFSNVSYPSRTCLRIGYRESSSAEGMRSEPGIQSGIQDMPPGSHEQNHICSGSGQTCAVIKAFASPGVNAHILGTPYRARLGQTDTPR